MCKAQGIGCVSNNNTVGFVGLGGPEIETEAGSWKNGAESEKRN